MDKTLDRITHITIGLLFCISLAKSQEKVLFAEQLTTKNGLSNNYTFSAIQDQKGFIWVSTADGLNRYDGYSFKKYLHKENDVNSLPNNAIRQMRLGKDGNILLITDGGISFFQQEQESFRNFYDSIGPIRIASDWAEVNFFPNEDGNIWLIQKSILYKINFKKKLFKEIASEIFRITHFSCHQDKLGNEWFFNNNEMYVSEATQGQTDSFYKLATSDDETAIHNAKFRHAHTDLNKDIWFWNDGLCKISSLHEKQLKIKRFSPNLFHNSEVMDIQHDTKNNIWLLFLDGCIDQLNPIDNSIKHYRIVVKDPQTRGICAMTMMIDNSDIIWLTTMNTQGGILKVSLKKNQFNYHSHNGQIHSVNNIFVDSEGLMWISSMSLPLIRYDREKDELTYFEKKNGNTNLEYTNLPFLEDNNHTIWLGTYTLFKMLTQNRQSNYLEVTRFVEDIKDSTTLRGWAARCLFLDRKGNLWYGNSDNVNMLSPSELRKSKPRFRHYRLGWTVWCIADDYTNAIWVGTNKGLSRIDTNMILHKAYYYNRSDSLSLGANNVKCIYESSKHQLWIGTEGGGLNLYNREEDCFIRYTEKDGLPSNVVWGILEDNNRNLWLSTNKGLCSFNPDKKIFKNYDEGDGLQSSQFGLGAYFKSKDGELFFGGVNGINSFYPDSIKDNKFIPPIVITNFLIYNKEIPIGKKINGTVVLKKSVYLTKELQLSYKDNSFSFEFASLDYTAPEKNKYAYMMEGFDKGWNHTDASRRFVTYTNLDPGQYIFKVKGTNSDGVWNEKGTSVIIIKILPPFWKTWWFRIMMFVILVLAIAGIFVGRIRQIEYQKRKLQQQVDEQTLEIRQQADVLKEVNSQLVQQQNELKETNILLEERQEEVMTQKEEIEHQAEELMKANATKDKFFSIIGHDLKNPMYAINSVAKMLKENCRSYPLEQIEEMSVMLEQSSQGVTALLENLLTWARSQSGKIDFKPENVNMHDIAESTILILKMNAENKGLKLLNYINKDTIAMADRNMVMTIIRNLVNNAIKFTQSGSITVRSELSGSMHKISVDDTGVGMSEEVSNKLFRIDVHHTMQGTSGESGTGLGLIICKEFVERNGGKIWVESEPGKGSSFIFTLPLSME